MSQLMLSESHDSNCGTPGNSEAMTMTELVSKHLSVSLDREYVASMAYIMYMQDIAELASRALRGGAKPSTRNFDTAKFMAWARGSSTLHAER